MTDLPLPQSPIQADRKPAKQVRVAIFSDALPERNGAGAYYQDLVADLGDEVEQIELFQPLLKPRRLLRLAFPLPGDPTQKLITPNVFRLRGQFQRLRPHVVVAVTPGPFGLLGLWFARRSGAGFLTGFHTHFEMLVKLYGNTWFMRIAHRYLEAVNRLLCRNSQAVLVNNSGLIETVSQLGARQVEIMGTPLSPSFIRPSLISPLPGLDRVLFAGRLAPEKNLGAILEAAEAHPDVVFQLIGEGPERAKIETAARRLPNLTLTGWLDREALREQMDLTSLLLLPSHHETFGTVALEALARGRPALVAHNAGIHDWSGLKEALFTIRSDETLATALTRLRKMPVETWQKRAAAARQAALDLHQQTIDQWADVVARYRRSPR
ncbi:MAG: glycosyltransferase [Opitutales bacterium]